ncbi:hypothetical protein MKW94_019742 [Papaver nudicaule]|uniref:Uncharacterized protein n=1 Tax=Papaver nudicaule TaxID=74823 RepID=A0AA41SPB8_PAPNU|nr:hypothetical protein [Papaver nudicaule]
MPEEKISRVSKPDYCILGDANAEAIRSKMGSSYVRYRSELAKHYRLSDSHAEALLHPSTGIRNVDDWTYMCNFFYGKEFKVNKKTWELWCSDIY